MPGGERHGIDLPLVDSEDGNERLTPGRRERIFSRLDMGSEGHGAELGMTYARRAGSATTAEWDAT